jgi:Lsr2
MAQKVEVTVVDDLDGGTADEVVTFGFGGSQYEIDLSSANADKLRDALAPYITAARKVSASRQPARGASRKGASVGPKTAEVREWAKGEGLQVSDRGRISADVVVKFQEAHS